jgi:hypothetical protein
LSRAAHELKGAAGNFDLGPLIAQLGRIEALATLGASTELDRDLDDLTDAIGRARFAVEAALRMLDASLNQAAR